MQNWIKITLMTTSCALATSVWADNEYYRYKDINGKTVISSTLTQEAVQQGYDVISIRGNVLKTVAPPLTKEQLIKMEQNEAKQKQAQKQIEAEKKQAQLQAQKDDILLKSFSSETDIVRSRDEKIASIEVLEGIVHENISRLKKQLSDAKSSATTHQKAGQAIPDTLQKTINESERQIQENEAFLKRKDEEKNLIKTKYKGLIERYHQLQRESSTTPSEQPNNKDNKSTEQPSGSH